jgi:hypothetical protein
MDKRKIVAPIQRLRKFKFHIKIMCMTFCVKGMFSFYCELPTNENKHKYSQKIVTPLLSLRINWPTRRFPRGYDDMSNPK